MALSEYFKKRQAEKSFGEIKPGQVMTAAEARKLFAGKKVGANPMEGKFKAGKYHCSKGEIYFRSQWEANYALYLDYLVDHGDLDNWEYESERYFFEGIRLGTNSYLIDFKVWLTDKDFEIHEVKGFLTSKAKTQLKRMKKYHPNVKVVLVERKTYDAILKSMKGLIKFYK